MHPGISFTELLSWIGHETSRFEEWFAARPDDTWQAPVGSGRTATVRDLMFHAYAVDLRYAQRLHRLPVDAFEQLTVHDAAALFALARRGQSLLYAACDGRIDLTAVFEFQTASAGVLRASGRKLIAHTLTHHVRHLAQVATALRQHGHPTDWMHDLVMSDAMI